MDVERMRIMGAPDVDVERRRIMGAPDVDVERRRRIMGGPLPHSRLTHGQCAWQSRFVPKAKPEARVMKGPNIHGRLNFSYDGSI